MNGLWLFGADVGDFIGFLIFLLFFIVSVVGSLANKCRQMQEEAARRGRPQRPARPPRPLDDEIADFLRTAGERREPAGQQRPGSPPARPAPARPSAAPPPPPARAPVRPAPPPPRPPVEQPREVKPLETSPGRLGETLATRTLTTGGLGQLTTEVAQADDRLQDHLRQTFNHNLSSLGSQEASVPLSPSALPPTAAAGVAPLLASAESLRNAIILSEILNRPEHRWE